MSNMSLRVEEMKQHFHTNGYIDSNSARNRKTMYEYLEARHIPFSKSVIAYTRRRNSSMGGKRKQWTLNHMAKLIKSQRLLAGDLEKNCCERFKFEDIKKVFVDVLTIDDICDLIDEKWGEDLYDSNWTPFDYCVIRKTIVRITAHDWNPLTHKMFSSATQSGIKTITSIIARQFPVFPRDILFTIFRYYVRLQNNIRITTYRFSSHVVFFLRHIWSIRCSFSKI